MNGDGYRVGIVGATVMPHVIYLHSSLTKSRITVSDDLGATWHGVGRSLPETKARVRGIAASADAATLLVSSDRGIYRSEDGGESWAAKEDNLPIHIEAGLVARDPNDAGVVYVVFSLVPYAEVWRMAACRATALEASK